MNKQEMEIKVGNITLVVGKKELILSPEEAKKLQTVLNNFFGPIYTYQNPWYIPTSIGTISNPNPLTITGTSGFQTNEKTNPWMAGTTATASTVVLEGTLLDDVVNE